MWWQNYASPTYINLGSIKIYYYSLILLVAVWSAYFLMTKINLKHKVKPDQLTDLVLLSMILGVIGGRLGFILQNSHFFLDNPTKIWQLTTGGLSIHGAIALVVIGLYFYGRKNKLKLLDLTDLLVMPVLLGQIIGRLGNYFNQELYGFPTDTFIGIFIDPAHRLAGYFSFEHFHPVFFYEMVALSIGLLFLYRAKLTKIGEKTWLYLIIFGSSRFIIEFWRIGDRTFLIFTLAQIISLILVGVGLYYWFKRSSFADNILQKK